MDILLHFSQLINRKVGCCDPRNMQGLLYRRRGGLNSMDTNRTHKRKRTQKSQEQIDIINQISHLNAKLKELNVSNKETRKAARSTLEVSAGFLQDNYACALNEVSMYYTYPVARSYTLKGPDHMPTFTCTITISGDNDYTNSAYGPTKKIAHEIAASRVLRTLKTCDSRFNITNHSEWIKDLLTDGDVEANPGPPHPHPIDFANFIPLVGISPGQTFTPILPPAGGYSLIFLSSNRRSGDFSLIFDRLGAGTSLTIRGVFERLPYIVLMPQDAIAIRISASTSSPSGEFTTIIQYVYGPRDGNVVITNSTPIPVTASFTTTPIDVNVINTSDNAVNTFVTNSSLTIDTPVGGALTTTIAADSLPLWTTNIGKSVPAPPLVGIEENPGPGLRSPSPYLGQNHASVTYTPKQGHLDLTSTLVDQHWNDYDAPPFVNDVVIDACEAGPSATVSIEEVWTENQMRDHLLARTKMKGDVGDSFKIVCTVFGFNTSNYFELLKDEELLMDNFVLDAPIQTFKNRDRKQAVDEQKVQQPSQRTSKTTQQPKSTVQLELQRKAVIARIAAKLDSPTKVFTWMNQKNLSPKWRKSVLDVLYGEGWQEHEDMCVVQFYAAAIEAGLPTLGIKMKICEFDTSYHLYSHLFVSNGTRADLEFAKLHNKKVHALNGNPLARSFKDICAYPTIKDLENAQLRALPRITGIELQVLVSNIVGELNPNQTDLFFQDRLRGNVTNTDSVITRNCVLPLPSTNLIPRDQRDLGQAEQYSFDGVRITEVHINDYYNFPIRATQQSQNLTVAVANAQTSNWRHDNTTLAGFNMRDISNQALSLPQKGLSLESVLLKIEMLHSTLSLVNRGNFAPTASSWSLINQSFVPTNESPILSVNDSPVPGEQCGGNDPTYPWGGDKGSISFHLTPETVPLQYRESAIFLPPGLLQSSTTGLDSVVYFVIMFTEWPFCMYTLKKKGTFKVPGFPDEEKMATFITQQNLTHIPGQKHIDVILPRKASAANPTAQGQANAMAVVRPETGSRATTGPSALPAGTPLDINFVGGDYKQYSLVDFLYSWSTDLNTSGIRQFLGRLGVMMGVSDTASAMREVNVTLCQTFPSMMCGKNDVDSPEPHFFPGNVDEGDRGNAMFNRSYASHFEISEAPRYADDNERSFPILDTLSADYRIFETNVTVWNRVVLNLATAENLQSEELFKLPIHYGHPMSYYWERLEAIPIAVTWAIFYSFMGLTALAWDQGYSNAETIYLQEVVRGLFCTTQFSGTLIPARYGSVLRKIMEFCYDRSPISLYSSVSETMIDVTHFDRWLPQNSFSKPHFEFGGVKRELRRTNIFIPVILPDIWIQYTTPKLPLWMASYPPPNLVDGAQGFNDIDNPSLRVFRNTGRNFVGTFISNTIMPVFAVNQGPEYTDMEKWNCRLNFTDEDVNLLSYDAQSLIEFAPTDPNQLSANFALKPLPRGVFLFPGESRPKFGTPLTTYCIPEMSADGRVIIPFLSQAVGNIYVRACNKADRILNGTWLLHDIYAAPLTQAVASGETRINRMLAKCKGSTDFLDDVIDAKNAGKVMAKTEDLIADSAIATNLPASITMPQDLDQPSPAANTPL